MHLGHDGLPFDCRSIHALFRLVPSPCVASLLSHHQLAVLLLAVFQFSNPSAEGKKGGGGGTKGENTKPPLSPDTLEQIAWYLYWIKQDVEPVTTEKPKLTDGSVRSRSNKCELTPVDALPYVPEQAFTIQAEYALLGQNGGGLMFSTKNWPVFLRFEFTNEERRKLFFNADANEKERTFKNTLSLFQKQIRSFANTTNSHIVAGLKEAGFDLETPPGKVLEVSDLARLFQQEQEVDSSTAGGDRAHRSVDPASALAFEGLIGKCKDADLRDKMKEWFQALPKADQEIETGLKEAGIAVGLPPVLQQTPQRVLLRLPDDPSKTWSIGQTALEELLRDNAVLVADEPDENAADCGASNDGQPLAEGVGAGGHKAAPPQQQQLQAAAVHGGGDDESAPGGFEQLKAGQAPPPQLAAAQQTEAVSLQKRFDIVKAREENVEAWQKRLGAVAEKLEKHFERVREDLQGLEQRLKDAAQAHGAEETVLATAHANLRQCIEEANNRLKGLRDEHENAEREVASLQEQLDERKEDIENALSEADAKLSAVEMASKAVILVHLISLLKSHFFDDELRELLRKLAIWAKTDRLVNLFDEVQQVNQVVHPQLRKY